jgi:radical SAM protein with 4Fe4S-binding SPASM domain
MKFYPYPISIIWEITSKCNLRCHYCSANGGENNSEMKLVNVYRALDEIAKFKKVNLFLSGGEPLLREDIFKILSYIKRKKINTILLTNGLLLSKETILRLKDLDIKIQIGLDSLDPGLHDFLRGAKGAFIRSFNSLKRALSQRLEVGVAIIATKLNFREIPNFINRMIEMGVSWVCVPRFIPCGRGETDRPLSLSINNRIDLIKAIIINKYYKENKVFFDDPTKILFDKEKSLPDGCNAGINKLSMDSFGNIMPCPMFRLIIGSIKKNSLKHIWNKSKILAIIRNRENIKGICKNCAYIDRCGGCRGLAYHIADDYLASDIMCPRVKRKI